MHKRAALEKKYLWSLRRAEESMHKVLSFHSTCAAKEYCLVFFCLDRETQMYMVFNEQNEKKCLLYTDLTFLKKIRISYRNSNGKKSGL